MSGGGGAGVAKEAGTRSRQLPLPPRAGVDSKVCYAFQKGDCDRGASCRFTHELAPQEVPPDRSTGGGKIPGKN